MAPAVRAGWFIAGFLAGLFLAGTHAWFWGLGAAIIISARSFNRGAFAFIGISLGLIYYAAYFAILNSYRILPVNTNYNVLVVSEPKPSGSGFRQTGRLLPPFRGEIDVNTRRILRYGDVFSSRAAIKPAAGYRPPVLLTDSLEVVAAHAAGFPGNLLYESREAFFAPLERALPEKQSAFLDGLLFGNTERFSAGFREEMKRSGTTHLVALSGYNIALLAGAISWIFGGFLPPRWMFLAAAAVISGFVIMTGAEPSVLRAAVMGIMLLLARAIGRPYSFGHAVLWTAFAISIFSPAAVFSPGFQLSFTVLLGISFLPPAFNRMLRFGPGTPAWMSAAVVSFSAFTAATPLTAPFGGISWSAIPANLLLLPLIPLTMFLGFAAGAASILPFFGFALSKVLGAALGMELLIIDISAAAPGLRPFQIPAYAVLGYYALLAIIALKYADA